MPCDTFKFDGGGGIVCRRGKPDAPRKCGIPDCPDWASKLCDYPAQERKTCDLPLCEAHAHFAGPGRDYCPDHNKLVRGLK